MTRLTRSMLFVPASRPAMIPKAAASAADAVCIDLEDAVAPDEKAASRANVVRALHGDRLRPPRAHGPHQRARRTVCLSRSRGDRRGGRRPTRPRDDSEGRTRRETSCSWTCCLSQIEASRRFETRIGIEAQIETAAGYLYAREIAESSPRLEALIFGAGDYAASMRMPSAAIGERDAHDEVVSRAPLARRHAHHRRCRPRSTGCAAWTAPTPAIRIRRDSSAPAGLPRHSASTASSAFTRRSWRRSTRRSRLLTPRSRKPPPSWRPTTAPSSGGQGAATHDGRMIDAANVRMARTTLERQRLISTT